MADDSDREIHVSTVEARAGSRSRMTRHILAASLILIIAVFVVMYLVGKG